VEIVADHDVMHAEALDEQPVHELRGRHARMRSLNRSTTTRSTPQDCSASSFSRSRVSRDGAADPSKYSRGVGSKVTTTAGTASCDARSRSAAMMCWWPR